jgi:aspartate kinase
MPLILQQKQWVVQKYGGTSLGKLLPTITGTIIPQYLETHNIAVVCSAISGTTKSLGTTSLLLKAVEYAMTSSRSQAELKDTIDTIRDRHLEASKVLQSRHVQDKQSSVFHDLDMGIIEDCDQVLSFVTAARVRVPSSSYCCMKLTFADNRGAFSPVKRPSGSNRREIGLPDRCGLIDK